MTKLLQLAITFITILHVSAYGLVDTNSKSKSAHKSDNTGSYENFDVKTSGLDWLNKNQFQWPQQEDKSDSTSSKMPKLKSKSEESKSSDRSKKISQFQWPQQEDKSDSTSSKMPKFKSKSEESKTSDRSKKISQFQWPQQEDKSDSTSSKMPKLKSKSEESKSSDRSKKNSDEEDKQDGKLFDSETKTKSKSSKTESKYASNGSEKSSDYSNKSEKKKFEKDTSEKSEQDQSEKDRSLKSEKDRSEKSDKSQSKTSNKDKSETSDENRSEKSNKSKSEKSNKDQIEKSDIDKSVKTKKDKSENSDRSKSDKIKYAKTEKIKSEKSDEDESEKSGNSQSKKSDKDKSKTSDEDRSEKSNKSKSEKSNKDQSEKSDKDKSVKTEKDKSENSDKSKSVKIKYEKTDRSKSEKSDKDKSEKSEKDSSKTSKYEKYNTSGKSNKDRTYSDTYENQLPQESSSTESNTSNMKSSERSKSLAKSVRSSAAHSKPDMFNKNNTKTISKIDDKKSKTKSGDKSINKITNSKGTSEKFASASDETEGLIREQNSKSLQNDILNKQITSTNDKSQAFKWPPNNDNSKPAWPPKNGGPDSEETQSREGIRFGGSKDKSDKYTFPKSKSKPFELPKKNKSNNFDWPLKGKGAESKSPRTTMQKDLHWPPEDESVSTIEERKASLPEKKEQHILFSPKQKNNDVSTEEDVVSKERKASTVEREELPKFGPTMRSPYKKPKVCVLPTPSCCVGGELTVKLNNAKGKQSKEGKLEGVNVIAINKGQGRDKKQYCSSNALVMVNFDKIDTTGCFGCLEAPYCGKRMLKIELKLSNAKRNGWLLNVGDSESNDGYRGDGGDQINDAETQALFPNITVYPSDRCPTISSFMHIVDAVTTYVDTVTLYISNEHVRITNSDGLDFKLCHKCLYALNGQPDTGPNGGPNQGIYIGLNRVVKDLSRTGYGVCSAKFSWECPWCM